MSRLRAAKVITRRAPLGGWNTRDPLETMRATDAPILTNWIPAPGGLKQRPGYAAHVTSALGAVATLMEYAPPGGSNALFAAIGGDIYNVTTAGALGASVHGSGVLTSAYWSHTMQTSAAVSVLFAVNGADLPIHWNGSAWANPAITGVDESTFRTVTNHKNRLWFTVGSLLAWYLPNAAIAGAATSFDLGPIFKKGGSLVNIGTLTRDGGMGPDDYIAFLSDKGEVVLYSGTDPSSASTWGLVGTFSLPPPVGRRCMVRVGADLIIVTVRGLIPMSQVMTLAESGQSNAAITAKIAPTFEAATRTQSSYSHWQFLEYPKEKLLICNIPTSSTDSVQYVMHTETMGWAKFEDISAMSWSLLSNDLYFGTSAGDVYKFGGENIASDNTALITSKLLMSYSGTNTPQSKRVTMVRALMRAPPPYRPTIKMKTNFNTDINDAASEYHEAGTAWDVGDWDTSSWGENGELNNNWQASQGFGHNFAPALYVSTDIQLTLYGIDIMFEQGGPL